MFSVCHAVLPSHYSRRKVAGRRKHNGCCRPKRRSRRRRQRPTRRRARRRRSSRCAPATAARVCAAAHRGRGPARDIAARSFIPGCSPSDWRMCQQLILGSSMCVIVGACVCSAAGWRTRQRRRTTASLVLRRSAWLRIWVLYNRRVTNGKVLLG